MAKRSSFDFWSSARFVVVFLIVVFVVGAGALAYFVVARFDKALESELIVYSSTPSPSGRLAAVIYELGGGATAPFNTQVSVAPARKPFSPKENPSFLSLHGQHDLAVRWTGDAAIEVVGIPPDVTAYRRETSVGDITVDYR